MENKDENKNELSFEVFEQEKQEDIIECQVSLGCPQGFSC